MTEKEIKWRLHDQITAFALNFVHTGWNYLFQLNSSYSQTKQSNKKNNYLIYYCLLPVLFGVLKVLLVMSRFQKIALNDADDANARS